jgi:uncharacterized membrane protein YbhN (UPF0104 family)
LSSGSSPLRETSSPARRVRRILLTFVRLAVGIALLVYLARSGTIDFRALTKLLAAWPVTAAAMALLLLDIGLMALRLCWLFPPQGLHLALSTSLKLTLISFFFATFLPGAAGGDLAKIYYAAKENSGRRAEIITVLFFDRGIGLFSLLLLPVLFAPLFLPFLRVTPAVRSLVLASAVLSLGMLGAFLLCLYAPSLVIRLAQGPLAFLHWRNVASRVLTTMGAYRRSPGMLLAALALAIGANLFLIAVTALAVFVLNPANLAPRLCLLIPVGHLVNSLPLTPGGLGVGEAAFNALFELGGLRGGAEALLCWRIWTVLVGLLGMAFYLRGFRKQVITVPAQAAEEGQPGERLSTAE